MLKFFRNIRQQLLSENKIGKYFKYAIGEIILVVIGILIALQLNNQNQERQNKKISQNIMENLLMEFRQNQTLLQDIIQIHQGIIVSTMDMMRLIGKPDIELNAYNLDSLMAVSMDYREFTPGKAVYTDLISSGRLNLLSPELRVLLFEWSIHLDGIYEAYKTVDEISQTLLLPYLTKHASLKNIDSYSIVKWEERSRLATDYSEMFQDLEFENNMENQVWDITNYVQQLERLEAVADRVIDKLDKELEMAP